jgi:hypothetical protein
MPKPKATTNGNSNGNGASSPKLNHSLFQVGAQSKKSDVVVTGVNLPADVVALFRVIGRKANDADLNYVLTDFARIYRALQPDWVRANQADLDQEEKSLGNRKRISALETNTQKEVSEAEEQAAAAGAGQ